MEKFLRLHRFASQFDAQLTQWGGALVGLALRCYVGWQFFKAGIIKVSDWGATLALFHDEYHVPLLPPDLAAVMGAAGELTFPVLLFVGLGAVSWLFKANTHPGALVWLFVAYIAFFALSQGAVIWVYIGEVFPNHVRSKGQAVGNASHWIMNTNIALEFPVLVVSLGRSAPFTFFAAMTVLQFVVVLFFYPETKGQTLEQLQRRLVKN